MGIHLLSVTILLLADLPAVPSKTMMPVIHPTVVMPDIQQQVSTPYEAIKAESLRTGKPVIVWVGGNFCDRCVNDSVGEFLHAFAPDGWEGNKGPATAVLVPHDGHLYYAGIVTRWTVGSHDWGHVPSARRIAAEWRVRAAGGNLAQLRMLNFGDGNWGWPSDRSSLPTSQGGNERVTSGSASQTNHRGSGSYSSGSRRSRTFRGGGG